MVAKELNAHLILIAHQTELVATDSVSIHVHYQMLVVAMLNVMSRITKHNVPARQDTLVIHLQGVARIKMTASPIPAVEMLSAQIWLVPLSADVSLGVREILQSKVDVPAHQHQWTDAKLRFVDPMLNANLYKE